jgi:DNA-binding response OmpR family regulator
MTETTQTDVGSALVIEDEPDFAALLGATLEQLGYGVEIARHFDEAMERIEASAPDLITLDIGLPGKSGLSLFHRIRAQVGLETTPIIVITGTTNGRPYMRGIIREFTETADLAPPHAFLEKPVDLEKLREAVRTAFD